MRYMMIVKANPESEAGVMPSSEELATMGRYNEELINAGVLLAAEGLHSSAKGARIKFDGGGKFTVTDGPFSETKELVAGFWIIDVKDYDAALAWAKKIPFEHGEEVEIRKVAEASDFPSDSVSEETLRKEQAWRDANQRPITN
jgi:hypothetical protein